MRRIFVLALLALNTPAAADTVYLNEAEALAATPNAAYTEVKLRNLESGQTITLKRITTWYCGGCQGVFGDAGTIDDSRFVVNLRDILSNDLEIIDHELEVVKP